MAAWSGVIAAAIDVLSGLISGGFWSIFAMVTSAAAVLVFFVVLNLVFASLLGYWQRVRGTTTKVDPEVMVAVILTTGFAALALLEYASSRTALQRLVLQVIACAAPLVAVLVRRKRQRLPSSLVIENPRQHILGFHLNMTRLGFPMNAND